MVLWAVTAGITSGLNGSAASVLLMSRKKAYELRFKPKMWWIFTTVPAVAPTIMGIGPVPTTEKAIIRQV